MCDCACRCVTDRILGVFAEEQKEQQPAHPFGWRGFAGPTGEQQCFGYVSALTVMEIAVLPASHSVTLQGCDSLGDLWGNFWLVKWAGLVRECGADSEHTALAYPRGRDGHSSPSLLPKPSLGSCWCRHSTTHPAPPPLASPTGCSVPSAPCISLGKLSHAGWWLQAAWAGLLGGREGGRARYSPGPQKNNLLCVQSECWCNKANLNLCPCSSCCLSG